MTQLRKDFQGRGEVQTFAWARIRNEHHPARMEAKISEVSLELDGPQENLRPWGIEMQGLAHLSGPVCHGLSRRDLYKVGSSLHQRQGFIHMDHMPSGVSYEAEGLRVRDYHADQEKEAFGIGSAALLPWRTFFPALNAADQWKSFRKCMKSVPL